MFNLQENKKNSDKVRELKKVLMIKTSGVSFLGVLATGISYSD
jgi:hypothetical protein